MSSFQEVFKRVEKKYRLDENKFNKLMSRIKDLLVEDKYGESTICNIYFDTPDFRLIRTSKEKPVYKEKMRMRSYGIPTASDTVFVELKKKYKGVVYKRRVDMSLLQAKKFTNNNVPPNRNTQIEKEIDWVMKFYKGLAPAMFLSYKRLAFYAQDDLNVRITFDSDIIYRNEALELDKGVWGNKLLNVGERIMEIKIPGVMPLWLAKILDELKIYPTSFSKYATAYEDVEAKKKKRVTNCA